jgi:hypothetical protein
MRLLQAGSANSTNATAANTSASANHTGSANASTGSNVTAAASNASAATTNASAAATNASAAATNVSAASSNVSAAASNVSAASLLASSNVSAASSNVSAVQANVSAAAILLFASTFRNKNCSICSDQCGSVGNAISSLNQKANTLCNIGDIPEVLGNLTELAEGMLTHIYLVNQWFYNKPSVLEIGNNEWDILNVIYPKYQHLSQQIDILKLDRDGEAICLDRYRIQNKIDALNRIHDRLANSSVANAKECGVDICGTLSQDASIISQVASGITVGDRFNSSTNALKQDIDNLNNLTKSYDEIYDYINQDITAGGNTAPGPEILVSWNPQTKETYADFLNNVALLVNNSKDSISSGLQAIYENTYAVPYNLWKNADFQLPELNLANEVQLQNCSASASASASGSAAGNSTSP